MEFLTKQVCELLFTVVIGIMAGFLYDIYRLLRYKYRLKRIASDFADLFFWLIITLVVFTLLLLGNKGEIRLYILLGLILGAFLYMRFLSSRATAVMLKTSSFFKLFFSKMGKPFYFVFTLAGYPFRFLFGMVFKNKYVKRIGVKLQLVLKKFFTLFRVKK